MIVDPRGKQMAELDGRFRSGEQEQPVRVETLLKQGQKLFLQIGFEVDGQIAAADQIDSREGRGRDQIVAKNQYASTIFAREHAAG